VVKKENITLLDGKQFVKAKKRGLGIKSIKKMNISLLCKWWWRLDNGAGLWQDLVKSKYLKNKVVGNVSHKLGDSPV
jgi:hypothetical protein